MGDDTPPPPLPPPPYLGPDAVVARAPAFVARAPQRPPPCEWKDDLQKCEVNPAGLSGFLFYAEECPNIPTKSQCNAHTETRASFGTDINFVPWNDDPNEYNTMERWCAHEASEGSYACSNMAGAGTFCKPMCHRLRSDASYMKYM